jgi:hypothetical protein
MSKYLPLASLILSLALLVTNSMVLYSSYRVNRELGVLREALQLVTDYTHIPSEYTKPGGIAKGYARLRGLWAPDGDK